MKLATLLLSCAFVVAPLAIEWKPKAGSEFERTFALDTRLELEKRVLSIDGEPTDDGEDEEFAIRSHATESYVFVDELSSVVKSRPAKLVRRFESLAQSDETSVESGGESESAVTKFESALEGRSVRFTWDDECGEYEREFVLAKDEKGSATDEELLAGLVEDLDLRGMLPKAPVEPGDTWDVDVRALDRLFRPGGDLHLLASDDEGEGQDFERHIDAAIDATLKGSVTAKFASVREVDGRKCAVIAIEGRSTANGDFDDDELGGVTIELSSEAEGEIVWDVAAGHVVSASLEAAVRTRYVRKLEFDLEGETTHFEDDMTFAGTTKVELKVVAR